jgi:UDP-N-acetyl-D-glucosamine dehydrogenase
MHESLRSKIASGDFLVGVIGLGYVGLPLVHAFHQGGPKIRILGFDNDPAKIESLRDGRSYLKHFGEEMTLTLARSDRFEATTDLGRLGEPDAVLVCVPTPVSKQLNPDLSYVELAGRAIGRTLRAGQLICLESTTYPGTTRGEFLGAIRETIEGESLESGRDYFVAFSPEREDPGRKSHSTRTIPKLVGGLEEASTDLATRLYAHAVDNIVPVSSAEVAESAKLLENIFRSVNIALVNELKLILTPMGIDVWEVIDAAATKPFGFMKFLPGPGLGGHCIPIDPFYLSYKAREFGQVTRFIELAGEINSRMPRYVVDRAAEALNDDGKAIRGSRVLVIGLAYKPNVDDTRETPAAEVIRLLADRGAEVAYHDPLVPTFPKMRNYSFSMESVELKPDRLADTDCVIIVTDHDAVDWDALSDHAPLIVDTRNAIGREKAVRGRVVRA